MRSESKYIQITGTLLFVLLLWCIPVAAERLPVKIFTSADGLGSGFVDYIYRDSRGFMWFCTRDGLSRFDGSRFVTFRIGDTTSPPGIESIFETRSGIYYVVTTAGTYRLRPDIVSDRRSSSRVMTAEFVFGSRGSFYEDSRGTVWMAAGNLNKVVERNGKVELEAYPLSFLDDRVRDLSIFDIDESADRSLWMHTRSGLVRMLPDERIVFYSFEATIVGGNNSMIIDRLGRVWSTMGSKVFILLPDSIDSLDAADRVTRKPFEPDRRSVFQPDATVALPQLPGEIYEYSTSDQGSFVENSYAQRLFETSDGTIWITAENRLFEIKKGEFRIYDHTQGLPTVMARMAEDSAGNLWIGGHTGLARLNRSGLITYGGGDGGAPSRFFAATTDADGFPVFAGRGHTLNRLSGKELQTVRPKLPGDSNYLWTSRFALRSSEGDWWMLSSENLYRFSGVSGFSDLKDRSPTAIYNSASGFKSDGMFQIFEDSKRRLWVSSRGATALGHGLSVKQPGQDSFRFMTPADGFPDGKSPASFAEDSSGRIWLGFYEGGLAVFDGEKFRLFGNEEGIPANGHITDIHIDAKGGIWLATSVYGLYRVNEPFLETPTFEKITVESTPLSNNIRTITEDRFGRLYLGTARGVDRYSPESGHVKRYTVSEGLAADFVVDSMRDRNGDLWFVTNDGVSTLTPLEDENPSPPQIMIASLAISGRNEAVSELGVGSFDTGELVYTDNNFQIDYFGLDLRAGEFLRYQYMLEGADQDWSPPTDQVTVNYANLRPGNYRFLVRAINTEGVISEKPATVMFTILSPIWLRWWFFALAVILIGVAAYAVYRSRTNRLKAINTALEDARSAEKRLRRSREERLIELERVRSRIATDLHDDIGASLTQIAILSEVARTGNGKGNGSAGPLSKITEVSNELVGTMSDIVWSINPSKDHLSDLVQRMRRFASDVLAPKGIITRFELPEDGARIVVDSNIRREIFLIFKESINNIAKHADAHAASVRLSIDRTGIELNIDDDGCGFDNKPLSYEDTFSSEGYSGNGIPSIQRRALEMGGTLEIESEIGKGTSVRLLMPRELSFDDSIIPNRSTF